MNFNEKKISVEELGPSRPSNEASSSPLGPNQVLQTRKKGKVFELGYDKLVIAVGCYSQTFKTPGVRENAFFLKDVGDARKIRKRILECK